MANTIRIKRRASGGNTGAPESLYNGELAFNEADNTLYYGYGDNEGAATSLPAIGGSGAFVTLTSDQTITGAKTFLGDNVTQTFGAASGTQSVNIASHDGQTYGLKLAGTLVTATAAELNQLHNTTLGNVVTYNVGISENNIFQAAAGIANSDFLRVSSSGSSIVGVSNSEVRSAIGAGLPVDGGNGIIVTEDSPATTSTISLDLSELTAITNNSTFANSDQFVVIDVSETGENERKIAASNIPLSKFHNDLVFDADLIAETLSGGAKITITDGNSPATNISSVELVGSDDTTVSYTDEDTITIASTSYSVTVPSSTTSIQLTGTLGGSEVSTDAIALTASGATSLTRTNDSAIDISSDNTTYDIGAALNGSSAVISLTPTTNGVEGTADTFSLTGSGSVTVGGSEDAITITGVDTTYTIGAAITSTNTATVTLSPSSGSDDTFTIAGGGSVTVAGNADALTITGVNTTYASGQYGGLYLDGTAFELQFSNLLEFSGDIDPSNDTLAIRDASQSTGHERFIKVGNIPLDDFNTTGDLSMGGNITAAGDLVATTGDVDVTAGDVNVTAGDVNVTAGDVVITAGALKGPSTFYIDPSPDDLNSPGGAVTDTGTVVILGDLTVQGTTTTINSTEISITDLAMNLADNASDTTELTGAGIIMGDGTGEDREMLLNSDGQFTFNDDIVATSSSLAIDNFVIDGGTF